MWTKLRKIVMVSKLPSRGRSFASDRALVEMAKTMDLNAIAKKTRRSPESVFKTAMRLGISIKGRPKPKVRGIAHVR
jgi:hypothetical protein